MTQRISAGELSKKAYADTTKYDSLEVGHAMTDDVMTEIRKCIENHDKIFAENEYCIVRIISSDPLISNLERFKYYGWLYLPKPRPNQAVFLYNKAKNSIRRLWVLPCDAVMAELAWGNMVVTKRYTTMQTWSKWFFHGWRFYQDPIQDPTSQEIKGKWVNTTPTYFYEKIREQHGIDMPSEHEFFLAHRQELIEAGCQLPNSDSTEAFDFSKISIKKVIDTQEASI